MTQRTLRFAPVLGSLEGFSAPELDGIVEIGYAMATANGDTSFDELEAVRSLFKYAKPTTPPRDLFDELSGKVDSSESLEAFVRSAAGKLETPAAREAAYKAAYAIAVFDLETNEDERELDDLLVEILGLESRLDDLERDVNEALMA